MTRFVFAEGSFLVRIMKIFILRSMSSTDIKTTLLLILSIHHFFKLIQRMYINGI